MFTFAGSSLSSRMHAIACAANASFSSIRSIWSSVSPARLRTFWVAGMGPSPMQEGSTPATPVAAWALDGEGILLGVRDLVALRDQLGRLAQRDRPVLFEPGIREPPSNGRVRGLRSLAAPRFARFEGYVGRARHVFDPARDEY